MRNRHGTPVDPVPFLVVSALGFTLSFAFGPIYVMEFGASLPPALVVGGFLLVGALALPLVAT